MKDYDLRVFGKNSTVDETKAGTSDFRIIHTSLSKAPSPQRWGAFGYEDVGWSMVTLESFARLYNIPTPNLTSLIDEWCIYMNCDYRKIGRAVLSLNLISENMITKENLEYKHLNWLPNIHDDKETNSTFKKNLTNKPLFFMKNKMKLVFSKTDEIDKRTYNSSQLLDPKIILEIYEEFKKVVPPIFGDNLIFGFVFGGFAKGYAVKDQDADFFICLKEENLEQITHFREWYFDLHQRYDLAPDMEFPGSITMLTHLKEKIEFAKTMKIRLVIETSYEKQAIVWTDIFSDIKSAKIGNLKELNSIETMCEGISQKWRIELLKIKSGEVDNEVAKLPLTRLFRKFVTYLKQGDRLIPPPDLGILKTKL